MPRWMTRIEPSEQSARKISPPSPGFNAASLYEYCRYMCYITLRTPPVVEDTCYANEPSSSEISANDARTKTYDVAYSSIDGKVHYYYSG